MTQPRGASPRPPKRFAALSTRTAFLLGILVFLPSIFRRDLWAPDEPRHAEVARTMPATGDWLVPHLNGSEYPDKPSFPFWLMGGAMRLTGSMAEFAPRLPSVLAAATTLAATHAIATILFSTEIALFSVLMLASSYLFLWHGQRVSLDMLMTCFTALAILGWVRQQRARGSDFANGLLFFGAAGAAFSVKGPMGILTPLLCAVVHGATTGTLKRLGSPRFLAGIPLFFAVIASWLVPAWTHASDHYRDDLWRQATGRLANAWNHEEPFYYYLKKLPVESMPWSPFLVLAIVLAFRKRLGGAPESQKLVWAWLAPAFVFLSIAQAKRGVYLLPLYPAAALGAALGFTSALAGEPRLRKVARTIAVVLGGLFLAAGVAVAACPAALPHFPATQRFSTLPGLWTAALLAGAIFIAGGIVALRRLRSREDAAPRGAVTAMAATLLVLVPVAANFVFPVIDAQKSRKAVAHEIADRIPTGQAWIPFCGLGAEEYRFYSGLDCRQNDDPEELAAQLVDQPNVRVVIVEGGKLKRFKKAWPEECVLLLRKTVSEDDDVCVLQVRKAPA